MSSFHCLCLHCTAVFHGFHSQQPAIVSSNKDCADWNNKSQVFQSMSCFEWMIETVPEEHIMVISVVVLFDPASPG